MAWWLRDRSRRVAVHRESTARADTRPSARDAIDALDRAGVQYCVFSHPAWIDALPLGEELDVLIEQTDLARADEVLREVGLHRLVATRTRGHRFYVTLRDGAWVKLDVKSVADDEPATPPLRALRARVRVGGAWVATPEHLRERAARTAAPPSPGPLADRLRRARAYYLPEAWRRTGPVIAFVGPDGVGKSTVLDDLQRTCPIASRVVYLGGFKKASASPPTAGGRGGGLPSVARVLLPPHVREHIRAAKRAVILWARLLGAYGAAWRGFVVLCDRHPKEVVILPAWREVHRRGVLRWLYGPLMPWPDASVILDAPADVVHARKPELPVDLIEDLRGRYRSVFGAAGGCVVSTEGDVVETRWTVAEIVWGELQQREARR